MPFPDANAPSESQPWVRDVTPRADVVRRRASMSESNASSLATTAKTAYELIDNRIANIGTFTTGLFDQDRSVSAVTSYASLDAIPLLYEYIDGSYTERACVAKRIPFSKFNELTITADADLHEYTTSAVPSSINTTRPLRPMIQATIPPLPWISGSGTYLENGTSYASRWTVENFEPSVDYDIPGNVVPDSFSNNYGQAGGYHPDAPGTVTLSRDGYTGYSMKYTRQWLTDYMEAIRKYTMDNFPPSSGRYLAPDVNRVEILLGWYYRIYLGGDTSAIFAINDSRLVFNSTSTFVSESIRNLGY